MPGRNSSKTILGSGGLIFGSLSLLPEPAIAEVLGATGYHFLIIDTEHVSVSGRSVETMIRACEAAGITPIVRVRSMVRTEVSVVLDAGAQGVVVPLLEDRATADQLVSWTRFPPAGTRTLCSATRAAAHGAYRADLARYLAESVREQLTFGLIETQKAVENIDEIVGSEVDAYLVGRADLSLDMGLGYAPNHPKVIEAARRVLGTALEAGRSAAIVAYDLDQAAEWIEFGCDIIVYSQPEMVLADFYRDGRARLSELDDLRSALRTVSDGAAPATKKK